MTLTDGAIMFVCCSVSFIVGYIIGSVRVTIFVNKRLEAILNVMTKTEKSSTPVPRSIESKVGDEV